jgi:hypothetical protein
MRPSRSRLIPVPLVQRTSEFTVRLTCSPQLLGALVQPGSKVDLHLFEHGQPALEFVDVGRSAESGGVVPADNLIRTAQAA